MSETKLLIADNRRLFVLGIIKALENTEDIKVVADCPSGEEAARKAIELRPDVVLLDSNITECDCTEVIRRIRESHVDTQIIVIDQRHFEDNNSRDLIDLDSDGYISDDIQPMNLINMMHQISSGIRVISSRVGLKALEEYKAITKKEISISQMQLTRREVEIISLVADGFSNREIAGKLYLSINSVKVHLRHILKKMQVSNRYRAAILAQEKGIIHISNRGKHT